METGVINKEIFAGFAQSGLCEYLLVAHPNKEVKEEIMEEKKRFSNIYHYQMAVKTLPHITVANFMAREPMEETLIRWMQRIIGSRHSFMVGLNNYSGFPSHTVYLRVQNAEPFGHLIENLKVIRQYVKDNNCPPVKLIARPHLTIARQLTSTVYEKAIMEYSQRTFHADFLVNELVLLKRDPHSYKCIEVSKFQMLPEQKNLFN